MSNSWVLNMSRLPKKMIVTQDTRKQSIEVIHSVMDNKVLWTTVALEQFHNKPKFRYLLIGVYSLSMHNLSIQIWLNKWEKDNGKLAEERMLRQWRIQLR